MNLCMNIKHKKSRNFSLIDWIIAVYTLNKSDASYITTLAIIMHNTQIFPNMDFM